MARVEVEAVVATSRPLQAYGGVRIGDGALQQIADNLKSGRIPMMVQHDLRRPLDATVLDSGIRKLPDGYSDVWIRFDVDAEQWAEFESELRAAGAPGGFSFSCAEPLAVVNAESGVEGKVELAADASYWSDEDLMVAAEKLRGLGAVHVNRRYEFAHEPASVVVLQLVLDLGVGVLAAAIYDALKGFFLPDRPTIFHFRVTRGADAVEARLETHDPDALRSAVESFDRLVNPGTLLVWDDDVDDWKPL